MSRVFQVFQRRPREDFFTFEKETYNDLLEELKWIGEGEYGVYEITVEDGATFIQTVTIK